MGLHGIYAMIFRSNNDNVCAFYWPLIHLVYVFTSVTVLLLMLKVVYIWNFNQRASEVLHGNGGGYL